MPGDGFLGGATRVLVYGVTGSGKTTLAERISRATSLPWHSVDDLTWEPGWVAVPREEQRRRIAAVCAGEEWILDTAYSKWLDIPLARAQLIVALDYPRVVSFQRLLRRSLARCIDKRTICNGNTETLRLLVSRDSILLWHFTSFGHKQERILRWMGDADGPRVVRLASPRHTEAWLRS